MTGFAILLIAPLLFARLRRTAAMPAIWFRGCWSPVWSTLSSVLLMALGTAAVTRPGRASPREFSSRAAESAWPWSFTGGYGIHGEQGDGGPILTAFRHAFSGGPAMAAAGLICMLVSPAARRQSRTRIGAPNWPSRYDIHGTHRRMQRHGDIAVLTIDNPPVNALSTPALAHPGDLPRIEADDGVKRSFLLCAGPTSAPARTCASSAAHPGTRSWPWRCSALDASKKLTVAAIHGQRWRGTGDRAGLRLSLRDPVCKGRASGNQTGLVSPRRGTQRLRAHRPAGATDLILTGDAIGAAQARQIGIIRRIDRGQLLEGAVAYSRRLVADGAAHRRLERRKRGGARKDFFSRSAAPRQ